MCIWLVDSAAVALGQRWRQEPGRWEFTGKMVVRPLQVEHWMERGFTREQAQILYARAVAYTLDTLGEHVYRYHERMDEYWFFVPPGRSENDIGEQLIATGYYRYVCPNWKTYPMGGVTTTMRFNEYPDDPLLDNQWHLKRIEAPAGWQIHHEGHDDVVLGVSDSGMWEDHPDLSNLNEYRREGWSQSDQLWELSGGNIFQGGTYCHGTIVLGAAAATGNNEVGVSGIGWSLRHRMLEFGNGHTDDAINTLWVSAEAGDRVICSTTGDDFTDIEGVWQLWADNTDLLHEGYPNVLIVHSAGNVPDFVYPPFPDMIIVGGTNTSDAVWYEDESTGSSVGSHVDVMAPAVGIYSTKCGSYGASSFGGTSWATPQVAGLCALIWSYDPELTANEVRALLYAGCDEHVGYDPDLHGYGRINVFNSLALASGDLWTRDPHPGRAGEDNIFKAAGATDQATVRFYYGTATGQTQVSGCSAGTCVGIDNASVLGTATATSNGAAVLDEIFVPSGWAETTVYLQAVDLSDCRVSNIIVYTFPPLN